MLSMLSEAALRLASCLDRLPATLAMLVRYCVRLASSRWMRSTRTAEIGSSDGTSMRSPLAICCISLPSFSELLFSEPCMVAVIWALEMRMVSSRQSAQNIASTALNRSLEVLMTFMLA